MTNSVPFFFGIPLRAKVASRNWDLVCSNLKRTLTSLAGQTERRFRVLLACHDVPDFLAEEPHLAAMVDVIDVSGDFGPAQEVEQFNRDKARKKRAIGAHLHKSDVEECYVMFFDADDLLHKRFVEWVLERDNKRGVLIPNGYIFNNATSGIALANEEIRPFYRQCGSCAVMYFQRGEFPKRFDDTRNHFSKFKAHTQFHEVAAEFGRPLEPMSEYVGLSMVNHGENNRIYKGEGWRREKYVLRHIVDSADVRRTISQNFPAWPAANC